MTARLLQMTDGGVVLGGRPVLRGVDLEVTAGEVVALLGANGSGKSTLVRALLGLVPLRRGRVELFGEPLGSFKSWQRIGYVPQRPTAAAGVPASVWEVVASGRLAHRPPLRPMGRADRAAIRESIAAVGLTDRTKDGVATLSGGLHQRVLVARALATRPDLLILDEPMAGVDLDSQDTFAALLRRLVRQGTSVLLVAHEMGALAPLTTRTVVMRDGRVAYDGPPLRSFLDAHPDHAGHAHHPAPPSTHVDYSPDVRGPWERRGDAAHRPQEPAP